LEVINKLKSLLTKRDKQFLLFLLLFSIFISIIETIGISAIMPFVSVASDFSVITSNQYYNFFYTFFNFSNEINFVIAFGILLIFFYIFRSIVNYIYFYLLIRFSQGRYHLLAFRLFRNYLGLSYKDFISKNSAYLTKSMVNEASNLSSLISAVLFILSEVFVLTLIYGILLFVNWKITIILTLILGFKVIFLIKPINKKIKEAGDIRNENQQRFYEIINSTFGNFKFIKLLSNENKILNRFNDASYGFAKANITNTSLQHFPRLFLEGVGFSLIVFVITYLVFKYQSDIKSALAIISMYILALYRLMPSVNRIVQNYNQISFLNKSLDIIHSDLMYPIENLDNKKLKFNSNIKLENIEFYFDKKNTVLNNLNLNIKKSEKIAFIGESGSGKSTLVDIVIGLYRPVNGNIFIDSNRLNDKNIKSWREKVGYIPQSVYLFDGTIKDNIVFNREESEERVIKALKQANIWKFLETKEGLNTVVGENGVKLSGGQKQRIAIARALYGEPEVLVLDEATSALDSDTERVIMEEIYKVSKNKTLIIIAHRLSTIENCDKIYKLENGNLSLTKDF